MPNSNASRPKGMLQSSHNPNTQATARTSGGTLNPAAGSFTPRTSCERQNSSKPQNSTAEATSTALVPHEPQHEEDHQVTVLASELSKLTDYYHEEILSLRRDIEMLKQGGWSVTIGAFLPPKQLDLSEIEATRQRLQNSDGLLGALTSRTHFFSPMSAIQQVDGLPSPPLTPSRASTNHPSSTKSANQLGQSQMNTTSVANGTERTNGGLTSSKFAANGATSSSASNATVAHADHSPQVSITSPRPHPDTPVPSTEDPSFTQMSSAGNWQPLAIRNLRPLCNDALHPIPPPSATQTFSWEFLRKFLQGKWWSPGFYYHSVREGTCILPSRTYYLLDASNDPYVPREPGAHGAKLTAFFNPENPDDVDGDEATDAYVRVPVFVTASPWASRNSTSKDPLITGLGTSHDDDDNDMIKSGGQKYVYMGMYSQLRLSDKLDYDRQIEQVPDSIKMYWAEQLTDLARPAWVTDALMKAFMPKPEYEGPLPGADADDDVVRTEVGRHVRDSKEWEEKAKKKVAKLTKEHVLKAFGDEDAADPPGLRLWWEYLECVGWDRGFYDMLVREQDKWAQKEKKVAADREGW